MVKNKIHGFLTHGVVKWMLEFLLTLGILFCIFSGAMIMLFRTDSYWMAVTSRSMTHDGESWRTYFENESVRRPFLATQLSSSIAENARTFDTSKFPIQGGFEDGDLLVVQGVGSVSDLSVGDVIIINRGPNAIPLTHRVFAMWEDNGSVRIATKGDHNTYMLSDDKPIQSGNVLGKVVFVIPKIGNIARWFQGR